MKKTLTVVTLLAASASQAAGLAIDTQSGRATGMGSVGVASSNDASSIFYNPAGLLLGKKLDAQVGVSLIPVHLNFTPTGGSTQTQNPFSPPPYAYVAYKISPCLAAGVGVFTPFGSNSKWPDDFVGRTLAKESKAATYDINPTVAFSPMEWLRFGAGVQIVYGKVDITRDIDFGPAGTGALEMSADDWGLGFNAGVQADIMPRMLTLGVHFRSGVKMDLAGDADFQNVPAPLAPALPDQSIEALLRLPASVGLGVAVTPMERLTLAFDANWVQWSTLQQLHFEFQTTPALSPPIIKDWHSKFNFRLGGEYGVTEALKVRAGLVFDPTPSPEETLSPDLPDADRVKIAVGAGYAISHFQVDAGYQLVLLQDQESTFPPLPGTYSGSAHVIGLTLGYSM